MRPQPELRDGHSSTWWRTAISDLNEDTLTAVVAAVEAGMPDVEPGGGPTGFAVLVRHNIRYLMRRQDGRSAVPITSWLALAENRLPTGDLIRDAVMVVRPSLSCAQQQTATALVSGGSPIGDACVVAELLA